MILLSRWCSHWMPGPVNPSKSHGMMSNHTLAMHPNAWSPRPLRDIYHVCIICFAARHYESSKLLPLVLRLFALCMRRVVLRMHWCFSHHPLFPFDEFHILLLAHVLGPSGEFSVGALFQGWHVGAASMGTIISVLACWCLFMDAVYFVLQTSCVLKTLALGWHIGWSFVLLCSLLCRG
ncbi:uncharacterized protein HMPREF1120_04486 [Exophiala dermatitidis NIH/UT8656]|uniref:Uncharacterized protein n=1 Tax=Exophiala dermatitidis (strain ATCC 34100 / CBS 525.76 / NIH/UT8656) TaxID=858893 RepID=H6C0H6_EXODN|nr:uncharacterized protein HMPREF1120_04486 [Exophiala dermatitidis NIH/UT8656]EHY56404.1 hypothetical protein HMPREF1120_04486 [Exophiala dermatitidis NIH/UT8656]